MCFRSLDLVLDSSGIPRELLVLSLVESGRRRFYTSKGMPQNMKNAFARQSKDKQAKTKASFSHILLYGLLTESVVLFKVDHPTSDDPIKKIPFLTGMP